MNIISSSDKSYSHIRAIGILISVILYTFGFSSNEVYTYLREHGVTYRKKDFLRDWSLILKYKGKIKATIGSDE